MSQENRCCNCGRSLVPRYPGQPHGNGMLPLYGAYRDSTCANADCIEGVAVMNFLLMRGWLLTVAPLRRSEVRT